MRFRIWPRSLAARTAVILLLGLAVVQGLGLTIHAFDRLDVQRLAQSRDLAIRVVSLYRTLVLTDPSHRATVLAELHRGPDLKAMLSDGPPDADLPEMPTPDQRLLRINMNVLPLGAPQLRWRELVIYGGHPWHTAVIGMHFPDGGWLDVTAELEPLRPWHSPTFLVAFLLMTAAAAALTLWAVRRMMAPLRVLANAAEVLGRDVNAPPLPEDGPSEIATAAIAFNTMAGRIRRFVQDRTELLTAIGHDLRTPITRLKLRAEFVEDEEQRTKILVDLEELEAMVSATLAFGRDARASEPVTALDLAELLRTILDDAADARPDLQDVLLYEGPAHLTIQARSLSLKRALANLVTNAVNYGGSATVRLKPPVNRLVEVQVEDSGPGIPAAELERVFEPFHRGEPSRNRETGGVGLGLAIARNILRAHGGDITLANRAEGGARATVTLPI
ncbi:MAG TPA: ATP-binding protein [Rhodopila sp.]|uniref:ATP-binding protein n=1 Tax=Rhodopila sp. TaxID=2480087 RepID=UPI002B93CD6D|nr:ATP-binding protein [Rhodopila sp.]HVY16522.1 ATP-binding protein [Rhodopila sp.]